MNLAQAQSKHDNSIDVQAERDDASERREAAVKNRIEVDPELMADALDEYLDQNRVNIHGHDLLMGFIPALIGAEKFVDAIAHGDALPDAELQAFRELCRQIETAQRRMAEAVSEAVMAEMSK
jgi:hypothetical protein